MVSLLYLWEVQYTSKWLFSVYLGDWLDDDRSCRAIEEAKDTSSGRADAMIEGNMSQDGLTR